MEESARGAKGGETLRPLKKTCPRDWLVDTTSGQSRNQSTAVFLMPQLFLEKKNTQNYTQLLGLMSKVTAEKVITLATIENFKITKDKT